jgi:hypothetical protein
MYMAFPRLASQTCNFTHKAYRVRPRYTSFSHETRASESADEVRAGDPRHGGEAGDPRHGDPCFTTQSL